MGAVLIAITCWEVLLDTIVIAKDCHTVVTELRQDVKSIPPDIQAIDVEERFSAACRRPLALDFGTFNVVDW